jgi:hypothetical protein
MFTLIIAFVLILACFARINSLVVDFLSACALRSADVCYAILDGVDGILRIFITWCNGGRSFIIRYKRSVKSHLEEEVVPFLQKWQMDDTADFNGIERTAMDAVYDVIRRVGHRPRCPASVEAVQRQIRDYLHGEEVRMEDIPYWSELATQMYFNPPFGEKAVMGVLPGFH